MSRFPAAAFPPAEPAPRPGSLGGAVADPTGAGIAALPPPCPHGGAFFAAVGEDFADLSRREAVIAADVLDAWFDPAPAVLAALREHAGWLARTSPPTRADGLRRVIAERRGCDPDSVVVGAGSSQLIHLAIVGAGLLGDRVLVPEPSYGEYRHAVRDLRRAAYVPFPLPIAEDFRIDVDALAHRARDARCSGVALVNPNNPSGRYLSPDAIRRLLDALPPDCRLWLDETYVDYADPAGSCEALVARDPRVLVCKSMSKAYALSGMRVAYLVAPAADAARLRAALPPWHCPLPAQLAAVTALGRESATYYRRRWRETLTLLRDLHRDLARIPGLTPMPPGAINALCCAVDPDRGPAATVIAAAAARGLFLRDCNVLADAFAGRHLRISVKDAATNRRGAAILAEVLSA